VGELPSGLVIHIPVSVEKRTYGPEVFKLVWPGATTGDGVSGMREGGRVDSTVAGIDPVLFGKIGERGVVVAVKKLQAMDMEMIANDERIRADFIFPPEGKVVFIVFLFIQKENPRPEWEEGVVIRYYYFKVLVSRSFFDARFGDVDFDLVASKGIGIVHADGFIGLNLIGHGDKGKAF
jgi:hypothetical protein